MFRHGIRTLLGVLMICSLAALAIQPAAAQADQAGAQSLDLPCATGISFTMLGQGMPQTAQGQALVQLELYFAPGGSLKAHTHPGALVVNVESGTLGFTMIDMQQGQMQIYRKGETTATPVTAMGANQEITFNPGDWFVEEGMVHSARNLGDTPVTVLISGLIQAGQPLVQCAS
jgi:quercetin dioxygenase-like cupin family protein